MRALTPLVLAACLLLAACGFEPGHSRFCSAGEETGNVFIDLEGGRMWGDAHSYTIQRVDDPEYTGMIWPFPLTLPGGAFPQEARVWELAGYRFDLVPGPAGEWVFVTVVDTTRAERPDGEDGPGYAYLYSRRSGLLAFLQTNEIGGQRYTQESLHCGGPPVRF